MRVLIVDSHHDARWHLVEGWFRALGSPELDVQFYGMGPPDSRDDAARVMAERGIEPVRAAPNSGAGFAPDRIIELGAPPETGPVFSGVPRVRWTIPDPSGQGEEDYRSARDVVETYVRAWLESEALSVAFGAAVRHEFALMPGITFLNHGSYGATPRAVLAAQQRLRDALEAQPVRFMADVPQRLRGVAGKVAGYLKADPDGLVFVENATAGVNTVLKSMDWSPGDVVVTTTHGYNAVRLSLNYLADRYGVRIHTVDIPFPIAGSHEVMAGLIGEWPSGPVRLAVFDHITSVTGTVWPVSAMIEFAHEKGAQVLIDGAHGPGQIPIDLTKLNADYWVGNCHKWLFAPKGAAVLYVAPIHRATVHPLVISHGYGAGLTQEFDWVGTRDVTAWLAVEAALDFVNRHGPDRIRAHNVHLRGQGAEIVGTRVAMSSAAPSTMLASLESRALPREFGNDFEGISRRIWETYRVECAIGPHAGRLWLRLSAQIYNTPDDYQRLADALCAELAGRPNSSTSEA